MSQPHDRNEVSDVKTVCRRVKTAVDRDFVIFQVFDNTFVSDLRDKTASFKFVENRHFFLLSKLLLKELDPLFDPLQGILFADYRSDVASAAGCEFFSA